MNLQHLCSAPHVEVYVDTWNNWLYLEWEGDLTLKHVQHACLAVAHCFVGHAYSRVLNNNSQLTSVSWEVAPWLAQHFFTHLALAGVQQMAWVYAPSVRGRDMAETALGPLTGEVTVALFADVEEAVSWLQQTRPAYNTGSGKLLPAGKPANPALARVVQVFEQHVHGAPALLSA